MTGLLDAFRNYLPQIDPDVVITLGPDITEYLLDEYTYEDIIEQPLIQKQISHIKYPEVIRELRDYIDQIWHKEFVSKILKTKTNKLDDNARNELFFTLLEGMAVIMDVYIIARMFRSYNMQRVSSVLGVDPTYIITYTGAAHGQNIERFLCEKLGFKITASEISDERYTADNQCINIETFNLPFFNGSADANIGLATGALLSK